MHRITGSTLLVTLGTIFFTSAAQAQMREACLIGPGGEDVFVRVDGHEERWPGHTLVWVDSNIGNARYANVTRKDTGASGSVRARFLRSAERCSNSPAPSTHPSTTPISNPGNPSDGVTKPIDFGALGDPFNCENSVGSPSECNKSALNKLARDGRKTLGYNGARVQIFQFVDAYSANGKKLVQSVYSNDILEITQEGIPQGVFNAEHTWPQSYLKKYPGFESSRSDIYHLLPCEIGINGKRGNLPFAECPGEPENNSGRVSELCGSHFEVPEQQKGMTARAMFYVSVSYNIAIDAGQEKILREWNKKFPPTATEIERSKRVQTVQGNINPFVNHPEWVELVNDF
jgi:endonuclease I